METIVCKFGGTSTADGGAAKRVRQIAEANAARRYIVVSAPGKRFAGDIKITDILYSAAAAAKARRAKEYKKIYAKARGRFLEIARDTGADERFLSEIKAEIERSVRGFARGSAGGENLFASARRVVSRRGRSHFVFSGRRTR